MVKKKGKKANKTYVQFDSKIENCWICEAWIECHFQINLNDVMEQYDKNFEMVDDLEEKYNVYMHFDFDEYDAETMLDLRK